MAYSFDGENKLIILSFGTTSFNVQDMYSRWKDWIRLSDNSKWAFAMTTIGGESISPGQTVAPYFFLNTTENWRIRPYEADHELRVNGNLYSIDSSLPIFVATVGDFTVTAVVERSASSIQVGSGRFIR